MSTGDNVCLQNPFFKNAERSAYEIGHLLHRLPDSLHPERLSTDHQLMAEAVRKHADNGLSETLIYIERLGELFAVAASNPTAEVTPECQHDIAYLFQSLASQAQLMNDTASNMRYLLKTAGDTA